MPPPIAAHAVIDWITNGLTLRHLHEVVLKNSTDFASGFRGMTNTPVSWFWPRQLLYPEPIIK
jgi:hypothetical protein